MSINMNKFGTQAAKAALDAQANTPRQAAEGTGDIGYGIFDLSKAPYQIKKWEPRKGKNLIMILPLEVTNRQNPAVVASAVTIGDYDYGVSLYTHMGKGTAAGVSHVCLKRNYQQYCPRCEEFFLPPEKGGTFVKGVKGSGNQDHASSERNYFIVVPFLNETTPDEENVGLWNSPANNLRGFPIIERAKDMADGSPIVPFWWPTEDGRLISFEMVKPENGYAEYKSIKFHKRDAKLALALANKHAFALDACLIIKDAQQITHDMFGGPDRPEPGAPQPKEPEYREDQQEDPGVDPDVSFPAPSDVVEAEYTHVSDPIVPEAPVAETPKPKASAPVKAAGSCPAGHVFGKDWQDHPECKGCKRDNKGVFLACSEAS